MKLRDFAITVMLLAASAVQAQHFTLDYNSGSGALDLNKVGALDATTVEIKSASGILSGDKPAHFNGLFDVYNPNKAFKLDPNGFGSVAGFANLAPGLTAHDLTVDGSVAGGGALGDVPINGFVPDGPPPTNMFVDFDGGGNTRYHLTNTSGGAPSVVAGGPSGSFLRLANLNGSNNNSVAFDENPATTGPAPLGKVLSFDFRMSDDAANTDAGGCCGSAADGMGIGYFATPLYGSTGPHNPADGGSVWERPVYPSAVTIGLDVFQNIDEVTLNGFGAELAVADVAGIIDLNNGLFHHGRLIVRPNPADATKAVFDFEIVEDVYGANPQTHSIFSGIEADINLSGLPLNRVIAGARTGGAFVEADLDNVKVQFIPEPGSLTLLGIGVLGLGMVRRRRS